VVFDSPWGNRSVGRTTQQGPVGARLRVSSVNGASENRSCPIDSIVACF
jgi:hypothetical protein